MLEAVKHFPKPQEQLKFPPYLNYKETTLEDDGLEGEFSLTRSLRESNGVYEPTLNKEWFPHTRHPEDLYKAYDNQWERLSSATQFAVTNDLHFLAIPPGLSREGFHSYVGTMLFQQPLVRNVSRTLRQLVD
jgi:hypothetical protein